MRFQGYQTESFYDEMFLPEGGPRAGAVPLVQRLSSLGEGELERRQAAAPGRAASCSPPWSAWHWG